MGAAAKEPPLTKIGIFSGTFDPVHAGHIATALEAMKQAGLEKVYFLPERSPRRKEGVTHYAHRIAMLKLALKPYKNLAVLELPDKQFSVTKTLPRLRSRFKNDQLYQIIGSDMVHILVSQDDQVQWPGLSTYLTEVTLVVGVRSGTDHEEVKRLLTAIQPGGIIVLTPSSHVASSVIRLAVSRGKMPDTLLKTVRPYVKKHWLYASIDGVAAKSSL